MFSDWPGQRLTAAIVTWGLLSILTTLLGPLSSPFSRRDRGREVKGSAKGTHLERDQDETTCAGCLPFALGVQHHLPHPAPCPKSLTIQAASMASSLSPFGLGLVNRRHGRDPKVEGERLEYLFPQLSSRQVPLPRATSQLGDPRSAATFSGFWYPFPPHSQQPCRWYHPCSYCLGLLYYPLLVSLNSVYTFGSPFFNLSSNYLLLMCHLILAGPLNETSPDSAVFIFNIYWKDEKTGILMTKCGWYVKLSSLNDEIKSLRWKWDKTRLSPCWLKVGGPVSIWTNTKNQILFLCYFQRAWTAF